MLKVYLSKKGKVEGPFLEEDLLSLEKSGEILGYSWLREGETGEWVPVDPTPGHVPADPVPVEEVENNCVEEKVDSQLLTSGHRAFVRVGEDLVKGSMKSRTTMGVEFCFQSHELSPPFSKDLPVEFIVASLESGQVNTSVMKVADMQKNDSDWTIYLRQTR